MEVDFAPALETTRMSIKIPAATLRMLIGEGSLLASSFRKTLIERIWTCGCTANYTLTNSDYVQWTPCAKHRTAGIDVER